MTRDDFWTLIESANPGGDADAFAGRLQARLAGRTPEEIRASERHRAGLFAESYTWSLWGAAYVINGGCSDDGFEYFRGWLMTRGRAVWEGALREPDSLAGLPGDADEWVECEEMLSVARAAFEAVTGTEMPADGVRNPELGAGWDFDDEAEMRRRYPKLCARCWDE